MLDVNIDKILSVADAKGKFEEIMTDVEDSDEMYVLTDNDKPSAVIVGVNHLEKLTGQNVEDVNALVEEKQKPAEPVSTDTPLATEDPAEITPVDVATTPTATIEPTPTVAEAPVQPTSTPPIPTSSPGSVPTNTTSPTIEPLATPTETPTPAPATENAQSTATATPADETTKDDDLFV